MQVSNFETDKFIEEIKSRPAVWNSEHPDYANKRLKIKAWEELCRAIFPDFDTKGAKDQLLMGMFTVM